MKTSKAAGAVAGFLFFAFLLTNCRKEYSYEGGTAVFSFLNINGSCSNPVISGNYIIGSTLGTSNSVQLLVDVTTAGSYSLQTNSRNGILFSSSGSFSDTGVQTVILAATGRPDSTGNFLFIPELAKTCSFSVEMTGQQTQEAGYTFIGAPNACSNALVSGVYQKTYR